MEHSKASSSTPLGSSAASSSPDAISQRLMVQCFRELFIKMDVLEESLPAASDSKKNQQDEQSRKQNEQSEWGDFVPLKREEVMELIEGGKKRTQVLQKNQYLNMTVEDTQRETKKRLTTLIRAAKTMQCTDENVSTIENCLTLIFEILHNGLMRNGLKVITSQKGGQLDDLKIISGYLYKDSKESKTGSNEIENNVSGSSYLESLSGIISTLKGKRDSTNNIVFLKALIASILCYFDLNQQESHKHFVELACHVLQFLINECYKLVYPDPRELLYRGTRDDASDAHLRRIQNYFGLNTNEIVEEIEKPPLEGIILTPLEFCQLFRVYSYMVQKALSTAYPFTITINANLLINRVLQEAFLLQAISTQVLKKPNRDIKSILYTSNTDGQKLQSSFYAIILPTIHSECLKVLSSLINAGSEQLLPYINSICQILVTETRNWKSSILIALCDYCNSEPYFEVYKELMRCLTILSSKHGGKTSEKCTRLVLPHLIDIISQFTYFVDSQIFSLPLTQVQQQHAVENYELSSKKKKKKQSTVEEDLVLNPEIFNQFSRIVFITLKAIHHMMNDSSVLITVTRQVDSRYKSTSETENSVVDVLNTIVDFLSCIIGFVSKWHDLDAFFSTSNISIYSASQVRSYHENLIPIIIAMYEALLPSLLSTSSVHTQSPFLSHALLILQKGKSSLVPELVSTCMSGLNVLEGFLHPKSAPLYVPSAESLQHQNATYLDGITKNNLLPSSSSSSDLQSRFSNRLNSLSNSHEEADSDTESIDLDEKMESPLESKSHVAIDEKPMQESKKESKSSKETKQDINKVEKLTKQDKKNAQESRTKQVLAQEVPTSKKRDLQMADVTLAEEKGTTPSKKRDAVTNSSILDKIKEKKSKQRKLESDEDKKVQVKQETPKKTTSQTPPQGSSSKLAPNNAEDFEDAAKFSSESDDDGEDVSNIKLVDNDDIGDVSALDLHF
ncbi:hypothetical protein C9374_000062 [Naegleria lovaniensis]|uniref:Uncharacterized protein n=1 Tax=Naegleria lovaniensis TaxID=51637 RepID=A0AA88GYB5_NAELO|nr:uncharacterized protein C9374_000062 [Naegleria lovaniensis]KAG2388623.1 hypothetical protein C9374_000062 [Naegleria lovaniensis]